MTFYTEEDYINWMNERYAEIVSRPGYIIDIKNNTVITIEELEEQIKDVVLAFKMN